MLVRRRQALEVLSISALDIFASALGVFILVAIILFPYYLKQPSLEVAEQGAEADLAAAKTALGEAGEQLADAEGRRRAAEAALAEATAQLQRAEAVAEAREAEAEAAAAETSPGEQPAPLSIADLDLVFVMDTTGSMRRELEDIQANLVGIVRVLHRLATSLRVGFVAYRDRGEDYLTRVAPLRSMTAANLAAMLRFVRDLAPEGGGDDPEAIDEALRAALAMKWRPDAQGRIIVIGDAPVHAWNLRATMDLAARFRRSAPDPGNHPRSVSAIFTGTSPADRSFFERLAAAGGGDFSEHREQMIESVLLSVLPERGAGAAR